MIASAEAMKLSLDFLEPRLGDGKATNVHKGTVILATVMGGGTVVTKAYASSIGAVYAKDGVEAVRVVEKLIKTGEKPSGEK